MFSCSHVFFFEILLQFFKALGVLFNFEFFLSNIYFYINNYLVYFENAFIQGTNYNKTLFYFSIEAQAFCYIFLFYLNQ